MFASLSKLFCVGIAVSMSRSIGLGVVVADWLVWHLVWSIAGLRLESLLRLRSADVLDLGVGM